MWFKQKKLVNKNIFLAHIENDNWNNLHAYHIENSIFWRNVAILSILALMIIAIFAMYFINQDKHKVLIFEKNYEGQLTLLGIANQTLSIDNKIIAHQLANFLIALREVPFDKWLQKRNINLVHKMLMPSIVDNVDKMIIEQYTKAFPNQISIQITSIKPLSTKNSWELSWQEELLGKKKNYSTVINFSIMKEVATDIQLINPVGIMISYINPTMDIEINHDK